MCDSSATAMIGEDTTENDRDLLTRLHALRKSTVQLDRKEYAISLGSWSLESSSDQRPALLFLESLLIPVAKISVPVDHLLHKPRKRLTPRPHLTR